MEATEPQPRSRHKNRPEETEPAAATELPVQAEPFAETNPPEKIDLQEQFDYGRKYAAITYGYEECFGLWDGHYPPDDHRIYTMEDGYKAVKASVDCTTRMLLARPGVRIATEINDVLCREGLISPSKTLETVRNASGYTTDKAAFDRQNYR